MSRQWTFPILDCAEVGQHVTIYYHPPKDSAYSPAYFKMNGLGKKGSISGEVISIHRSCIVISNSEHPFDSEGEAGLTFYDDEIENIV